MVMRVRADVLLPRVSDANEDKVQHHFYVTKTAVPFTPTDYAAAAGNIEGFYNIVPPGFIGNPGDFLSPALSRVTNDLTIRFFDLDVAGGSPVAQVAGTLAPITGDADPLPAEVSIVISYAADLTGIPEEQLNTRPASRRRNRLFFGPLNVNTLARDAGTDECVVPFDMRNLLVTAFDGLKDAMTTDTLNLRVYSPTTGLDFEPVRVWCDDAFDTQRRRGERARVRTTLAI